MYYTCMFGMVGVMVCMKEIMAVLVQMGKSTVFRVFTRRPMIVGMEIVIMLIIGIFIMVVAVAMGSGLVMVVITVVFMIVRMGIMAVSPVIFLSITVVVIIPMCMFIMGMSLLGLFHLPFLTLSDE